MPLCPGGQLSAYRCSATKPSYYCCPGFKGRGTCVPGLGFYSLSNEVGGYAAVNCGGKNAEYFDAAPPPTSVNDLVNYAKDTYSGQAGYFPDRGAAYNTNPFKDVDVDAIAAAVLAGIQTAVNNGVGLAQSSFNADVQPHIAECAKTPGCSYAYVEITDFTIVISGTDPDGAIIADPDDPGSPVIPRPEDPGIPSF